MLPQAFFQFLGLALGFAARIDMAVAIIPMADDFQWDKEMQSHILGAYNLGRDLHSVFQSKKMFGTMVARWL